VPIKQKNKKMKNKPVVIGVGEFLWDVLPSGKKAGGAPVNFAYHASQNGVSGWAISAVGNDDLGTELLETSKAYNINTIVDRVDYPTSTVQVKIKDGIPDFTICEDVAWNHIPLTERALELARKASAISFGTLAQRSKTSRYTTVELIESTPENALRVYDINLRQHYYSKELIESSLLIANVFKINDEELEVLKKMFDLLNLDTDSACGWFMEKYKLQIMAITGGSHFSSVYSANEKSIINTPKVTVVDTVGAGDAFSGALIASLLFGKSIREAHQTAVDVAAYVCTQAGAWTQPKQ
jgi:fructokinase